MNKMTIFGRKNAVAAAVGSTRIEGLKLSRKNRNALNDFAKGSKTLAEAKKSILKNAKPR